VTIAPELRALYRKFYTVSLVSDLFAFEYHGIKNHAVILILPFGRFLNHAQIHKERQALDEVHTLCDIAAAIVHFSVSARTLAPNFRLVRLSEEGINAGCLEGIDALLGKYHCYCSILVSTSVDRRCFVCLTVCVCRTVCGVVVV